MKARMAYMAIDVHGQVPQGHLLPVPVVGIFPAFLNMKIGTPGGGQITG
jgi:hypothetical protein